MVGEGTGVIGSVGDGVDGDILVMVLAALAAELYWW